MLEQAIADAAEHAERMLKTFKSGCAVAEDLLQLMIDKLDVVRQHASGVPVPPPAPAPAPEDGLGQAAAAQVNPAGGATIASDTGQPAT